MLLSKNLSVFKQGKKILSSVDISILSSEIVCIVGRNGAGKSTLLRAIAGLEPLEEGDVYYKDYDLLTTDRNLAIRELGIMLSPNSYYEYMTCVQNLEIVQRYYGQTQFSVDEMLELFNLTAYKKQKVNQLSSGTKQRLSLALTFINCPSLVILDEPFNSIDRENTRQIVKLIQKLNHDYHTAFLITSHSFDDVEMLYTKLAILKNGEIATQLTRKELENFIFYKIPANALLISYESFSQQFPTAKLEDDHIFLLADSTQSTSTLAKIESSIKNPATPKHFYELFG